MGRDNGAMIRVMATLTRAVLEAWSASELIVLREHHPEDVPGTGSLLVAGAEPEEISALERRLDATLPPSYRSFLKFSNGTRTVWNTGNTPDEPVPSELGFWSCEYVDWFARYHADWVELWIDSDAGDQRLPDDLYFDYSRPQDSDAIRVEHLDGALQISGCRQGEVFLLNPHARSHVGEWELWYLGTHIAGAYRLRCFADFFRPEAQRAITPVGMPV